MGLRSPVDEMSAALSEIFAGARIEKLQQLSGGASRETWSFEAAGRGLILQRDGLQRDEIRLGFAGQAQLLRAARTSGVPVPDVVMTSDSDVLGDAMIVARIDGETIPRRILREDSYSQAREGLAAQCGETLARIHSISLDEVRFVERRDEFALYRRLLDDVEHAHPAFELAFRWLERNRPRAFGPAVVHGDFRLGNVIVGEDGIRAVIDWELAHVGDPMEDLGWLCVKSWRFGGAHPVGGFGTREQLLGAYESVSERTVDPEILLWWEIFGNVRWGVICIVQMMRHLSGAERSVELVTIGRRVAESEHDVLLLLP